ncbi:MAG TPA: M48 family metalloprotease [Kofleriaceae bacterium]|nr:M48 family metalloprotease [Kofleriaceae bacterium]
MTLSLRRAPILVGALCLTLGATSASASRGVARSRPGKPAAAAVTRGAMAKRVRPRQLRGLRPAKKITRVRKPVARRSLRRAPRVQPLSLVKGLIGALTNPAERLIADITVSLVKYQLKLREHNPFTGEVQRLALSQADEVALGAAIATHVVPATGVPLSGSAMEGYLDRIVQRLVRANGIDQVTPYRFKVHLVRSDTVNAFAAPGGRIVVTTALLARMKSEASIAAILAHEIGHVVARHGSQNLARSELVQELLGKLGRAAGNDIGARLAVLQSAGQLEQEMLSFSRDQEHQSDALGVRFLAGAGYSARGVEEMADFLISVDGSLAYDDSDSDHPSPVARRTNLYSAARERGMTYTGEHGAERFALNVTLPLALGIF